MRVIAFLIITGILLILLFFAIMFGVAMGIIVGNETLKKGGKKCKKS